MENDRIMEEEEEEEEGLLPNRQIKELEEQNRQIWLLYKDAEQEALYRKEREGPLANPLSLTPGVALRERGVMEEEEEDDDEDEFDEDDVELRELLPLEQDKREVKKQNRIIHALYEDSLHDGVPSTSFMRTPVASETSGTRLAFPHYGPSTNTYPNTVVSSTQSLAAVDGEGRLEGRLEGILAQEPSVHKALHLNLAMQQTFRSTIAKLEEALKKNQQTQAQIKDELEKTGPTSKTVMRRNIVLGKNGEPVERMFLRYSHLSIPYFKDASGMTAPMNEDAKKKINSGYLDLYTSRNRSWLLREQRTLMEVVRKEWKRRQTRRCQEQINSTQRQIKALQKEDEKDKDEEKEKQVLASLKETLAKFEEDLQKLAETPLEDLDPPPRYISLDWEEIAAQAFDGFRSSVECQLMWENLLHPDINRGPWTEEEDLAIQNLVKMPGKNTNWDAIAKCLKSNRTGYLVMQRWVSFLLPTLRPVQWGARDTKKLLDAVSLLRTGEHIPWTQVHQHLPGFTRAQVYSRWQVVNPENHHGHFTIEEDLITIKGLYMFGLNFVSIAHFLPGRTPSQVRLRFRRTFVASMTNAPWSSTEDKILLRRGKVGVSGWRKLVWYLPRRLPIQMRCRYLTLLVWHGLKGTEEGDESPPPLFPITMTTDQEEIRNIRTLMLDDSSMKLKEAVDRSRKRIDMEQLIQELEEKRVALQEKSACDTAQRIQRLMGMRGRPRGSVNQVTTQQPLQKMLLDQFFAPARPRAPHFPVIDEVVTSMSVLSDAMLLRPTHTRDSEEGEAGERTSTTYLTQHDLHLFEQLAKKKGEEQGKEGGNMKAADVPFIPPNKTTVGAMLSILIHLPVLSQMASGQFIFQNFFPEALATMSRTQLSKIQHIQHDSLRLQANYAATPSQQNSEGNTIGPDSTPTASSSTTTASLPNKMRGQDLPEDSAGGGGEEEDSDSQQKGFKIHITSESKSKVGWKKMLSHDAKTARFSTYLKGNRRSAGTDTSDPTTLQSPSTSHSSHPQQNTAAATSSSITVDVEEKDKQRQEQEQVERREAAKAKADELLFQRMSCLFFWPTLMRLEQPSRWQVEDIESRVEKLGAMVKEQEQQEAQRKRQATISKTQEEEVEETSEYIKELARKLREDIARRQQCKQATSKKKQTNRGRKRKTPPEPDPAEEGSPEKQRPPEPDPTEEGSPEKQGEAVLPPPPPPTAAAASSPPPPPHNTEVVVEEISEAPSSSKDHHSILTLNIAKNKVKLKRLSRSVNMKKLWEARKQGVAPPRKKRETYRNEYQPRGSRRRQMDQTQNS